MVAKSIYEAAKRAEAYLHDHDVRSEEQLAEKTPSLPPSKASTQPQSNLSTQAVMRQQSSQKVHCRRVRHRHQPSSSRCGCPNSQRFGTELKTTERC